MIYPIAIYLCLDRKYSRKIDIIYVLITAYGLLKIGTKVGLLSFYISSVAYIVARILNFKKHKLNYGFYAVIVLVLLSLITFDSLPAIKNIKFRYEYTNGDVTEVITSGRDGYLNYIQNNDYDNLDYIVGKMNIKDGYILLIEMDVFDMFYMFGITGFIIIYGTILFVAIKIILKYKENILAGIKYTKITMLVVCLVLVLLISMIAGHVILCPSVSIYAALICGYLCTYDKFEKAENNKKKLLFGAVHLQVGGIEKTLINLLNKIDYDKYEVDLCLLLENGIFYKDIPKEVKVITPYSSIFSKFFAKESKLSKLIKHLLFNKYTSWLWTNNKNYDIAINYPGYYLFIDYYISHTYSNKKYIWLHQSVEGLSKHDPNFKRNFVKNVNKYKKYDNIVCVSNSAKKEFDNMFSEYKDKSTVVLNIQDNNINYKEKVKYDGEYNIVSVGRLCTQKAFHRLIEVHKKLIDDGYKINTYILGNGEKYNELTELINKNNINDSFKLLGQISNVSDYLKAADLFVSTSYYEALPTVLLEALMCNLPWVGPNVTGVKDIHELSPKNSSILTDDNVNGIASGVKKAIDGKINKQFIFDIDKYNDKAIKQFYKLIGD